VKAYSKEAHNLLLLGKVEEKKEKKLKQGKEVEGSFILCEIQVECFHFNGICNEKIFLRRGRGGTVGVWG
jgi:hypothetical protein